MTPRIQPYDHQLSVVTADSITGMAAAAGASPKPRPEPELKNLFNQTYEERWSDASVQKVAETWKLTPEEQQQLMTIKASITDVTSWKNNPLDLIRILRGPGKFDLVEPKFRDMIAWRVVNNCDRLLEDYRPPKGLLWYIPSAILKGYDKDGDPIYLERGGVMDGLGLVQKFNQADVVKHVVWLREISTRGDWIQDYERTMGRTPSQVTIIYDMQGMSSRHLKNGVIPMFKEIVAMNQTRYCGLAKRIILLRAPSIFQFIWNIAKHFFPPEGRKLMVFTSPSNYQQVLDQYVDRDVLPPCICKEGKGSPMESMPQNYGGGLIPKTIDTTIPDEAWIRAFQNGFACPKQQRPDYTVGTSSPVAADTSRSAAFSPRTTTTTPPEVPQIPPVCLSDYRNVKIMNVPQAQWSDEFESVLNK